MIVIFRYSMHVVDHQNVFTFYLLAVFLCCCLNIRVDLTGQKGI